MATQSWTGTFLRLRSEALRRKEAAQLYSSDASESDRSRLVVKEDAVGICYSLLSSLLRRVKIND